MFILKIVRGQEWLSKAERIRCPAPLPEGSPSLAIARMLSRVLSQVPSGKDGGKNRESELHTWPIQIGGITMSTEEDSQGGESKVSSPRGKKRAASEDLETEVPRQGKKTSPGALPRRASSLRHARKQASPPPSCKLIVNTKLLLPPLRSITRIHSLQSG